MNISFKQYLILYKFSRWSAKDKDDIRAVVKMGVDIMAGISPSLADYLAVTNVVRSCVDVDQHLLLLPLLPIETKKLNYTQIQA